MTIETIDHVTTGVDRLTYKLQQENIEKLLTIFLEKSQEIEDEFIILANQKSIDLAEGIWLDYIGKIVGVKRDNLSDEEYRVTLKFQIGINTADGTPNIIIDLVREFTDSVSVRITESGIAFATLSLNGQNNISGDLWGLLQDIRPVGTRWIIHSDFFDNSFLLAYENNTSSSEPFQVSDDGIIFENFEVTTDGVNFEPLFIINESQSYYEPSLVDGRNDFYYEEPENFQVTNDGVSFEDFEVLGTGLDNPILNVIVPYDSEYIPSNVKPLHWEVEEDSISDTSGYDDMLENNEEYNTLSEEYETLVEEITVS